jgi:hypothetical protein
MMSRIWDIKRGKKMRKKNGIVHTLEWNFDAGSSHDRWSTVSHQIEDSIKDIWTECQSQWFVFVTYLDNSLLTQLVSITLNCNIQPWFRVWMCFNHKKSAGYKLQDVGFRTSIRGLVDTKDGISVCNDPCFFKYFIYFKPRNLLV